MVKKKKVTNIHIFRAKYGISQDELAKGIGMSRQAIHSIEVGKHGATIITALKIAKFFKTTVEKLFITEDEKEN